MALRFDVPCHRLPYCRHAQGRENRYIWQKRIEVLSCREIPSAIGKRHKYRQRIDNYQREQKKNDGLGSDPFYGKVGSHAYDSKRYKGLEPR